jgi:hypothetical protein
MEFDDFEQEKLRERFKIILDRECSLANLVDSLAEDGIFKDVFSNLLYDHRYLKTTAEFTDDWPREYARIRIAEELAKESQI